jgi:hypothetical protein
MPVITKLNKFWSVRRSVYVGRLAVNPGYFTVYRDCFADDFSASNPFSLPPEFQAPGHVWPGGGRACAWAFIHTFSFL